MSRLSENLAATNDAHTATAPAFTTEQRHLLLGIARASIASGLVGDPLPDSPPAASSFPALTKPRGVFTTIYLAGELRGCVGFALPVRTLFRAVAETARAAAFEDTRFWPLTPEEAPGLQISLSVLSPLFSITAGEVEVGRHGLLISSGMRRGLRRGTGGGSRRPSAHWLPPFSPLRRARSGSWLSTGRDSARWPNSACISRSPGRI